MYNTSVLCICFAFIDKVIFLTLVEKHTFYIK